MAVLHLKRPKPGYTVARTLAITTMSSDVKVTLFSRQILSSAMRLSAGRNSVLRLVMFFSEHNGLPVQRNLSVALGRINLKTCLMRKKIERVPGENQQSSEFSATVMDRNRKESIKTGRSIFE